MRANLRGIRTTNKSHESAILSIRTPFTSGSTLRSYIYGSRSVNGTVKNISFDDSDAIRFPRINPMAHVSMIEWQIRNFFTDPRILLHRFTFHYHSSTVSVV